MAIEILTKEMPGVQQEKPEGVGIDAFINSGPAINKAINIMSPSQPASSNGTAIIMVDIEALDGDITGLEHYKTALLIYRYRRVIVGRANCPVRSGIISAQDIRSGMSDVAWPVWHEITRPTANYPLPTATIAVCTRNRTDDLAVCIQSLLPLADQGYEVLIIDNCPSDSKTQDLVNLYPQIQYVHEPNPGLDYARNRALMEARTDVVAFTDDDARVDEGWLISLLENFEDPTVAVVTGITLPAELDTEAQRWFEATNGFGRGFVRQVFEADTLIPLASGRAGAGVNMAIRRSALDEIGLFDVALDGGTLSRSGGDQEFFYRALARGFRIVYEPRAIVWHKHRREWESLRSTLHGYGVGVFAWWTSAIIHEREVTLLWRGPGWFVNYHVRNLAQALLHRPGHMPLDLCWAEFKGALIGSISYIRATRRISSTGRNFLPHRSSEPVAKLEAAV